MEEQEIHSFLTTFTGVEEEIKKQIIGQQEVVRQVLVAMVGGGNVLLEGLPGLGKTQLIKTIGHVMGLEFSRIQFTPDLMPADVTGTNIMEKGADGTMVFRFQKGPIFANIVLADEINRATPKTQSALLEAMQEHTVTSGGKTYSLPEPYFVLATQNPLEMDGTYPLPEAQMDRFMFWLSVEFPEKEDLLKIVTMTTGGKRETLKQAADADTILKMRAVAAEVAVAKPVLEYIVGLVAKTHPQREGAPELVKKYVRYGASPRGAQAVLTAARVYGLLDKRYNVSFEDVRQAAPYALKHRIFLNFEASADGVTAEMILKEVLKEEN